MIIAIIKNYEINNANAICEYMIILNVLFVSLFLYEITFSKNFSGMRSEHHTVWILIRSLIWSGLIWVKNVCKAVDIMS